MSNSEPKLWPVDPDTGNPIPPRAQPGYYPGYSTLSQQDFWDAATRKVVLDRVNKVPPIRFFTQEEAELLRHVCDRMLPQDDRDDEHRIPIVNSIDHRLDVDRGDGYRYENMPPDREAFRLGLQGIDEIARHLYQNRFIELSPLDKDVVLKTLHDNKPPAGEEIWKRMPAHRFFMLLLQDVVEVYYAHPWAWDEIGYGGPAYPRGYMRLEGGKPEYWEVDEVRYEWAAPPSSLSGDHELIAGTYEHSGTPGQGGTH